MAVYSDIPDFDGIAKDENPSKRAAKAHKKTIVFLCSKYAEPKIGKTMFVLNILLGSESASKVDCDITESISYGNVS